MIEPHLEELLKTDSVTATAASLMALHLHRRDEVVFKAAGLPMRVDGKVIRLLAIRERIRTKETNRFAQAIYLQSQIKVRQKQLKELIKKVEMDEQIPDAIEQAEQLQIEIETLSELLARLESNA